MASSCCCYWQLDLSTLAWRSTFKEGSEVQFVSVAVLVLQLPVLLWFLRGQVVQIVMSRSSCHCEIRRVLDGVEQNRALRCLRHLERKAQQLLRGSHLGPGPTIPQDAIRALISRLLLASLIPSVRSHLQVSERCTIQKIIPTTTTTATTVRSLLLSFPHTDQQVTEIDARFAGVSLCFTTRISTTTKNTTKNTTTTTTTTTTHHHHQQPQQKTTTTTTITTTTTTTT
jgi:hypothetical protein